MKMTGDEVSSCLADGKTFPPGFRFHPTDEELVLFYLKRKICRRRHQMDVITDTDVYKWEPHELPGLSKLKTGDRQWFFYSPKDRKYPHGGRSNRATSKGYWKATGKDRVIVYKSRDVGVKKTLVFYRGRAPTGERTDWVMHEYLLNEEELRSCNSEKDYYALYKLFKKSGPGPKNGEQYGAPFREEDWVDDGIETSGFDEQENCNPPDVSVGKAPPANMDRAICQLQPLEGLEEFVNGIPDGPLPAPPLSVADYGFELEEFLNDEEADSGIVNQPTKERIIHEESTVYNVQACVDLPHSSTASGMDLREVEDFLEMDDLMGPQPSLQNFENLIPSQENVQFDGFDGFDGLSEFDFGFNGFADGQVNLPFVDNLEIRDATPVSNLYFNTSGSESIYHDQRNLSNVEDGAGFQEWSHDQRNLSNVENDAGFQEWSHDQRSSVYSAGESYHGTVPPATSGVVYDGNFLNHGSGADTSQSGQQNDGTNSWISSALWSFVESIPTAPASAAESGVLVNRAFERMSSFGRVKVTSGSTDVVPVATSRSSGKCKSGFFCFSLLGVMCAFLWMLMGASAGVAGKHL